MREKNRHVSIVDKDDVDSAIAYWREKTPEERLSAVEFLREQYYCIQGFDKVPRISKSVTIVEN